MRACSYHSNTYYISTMPHTLAVNWSQKNQFKVIVVYSSTLLLSRLINIQDRKKLLVTSRSSGGIPVSYTHLDVYKRQYMNMWNAYKCW